MSVWYPCIYCTEDLKCTKNSGDGVISFCVLGPCHDETPSNADRIRSMTDEQLAAYIGHASLCVTIQGEDGSAWCSQYGSCNECIRDWLKQGAHDET